MLSSIRPSNYYRQFARLHVLFGLHLLVLPLLCPVDAMAQGVNRFRNFHGIVHPANNVTFFEAEGSEIFIERVNEGLDEKGLSRIRKRYAAKDALLGVDEETKLQVLHRSDDQKGVAVHYTYYLLPVDNANTTVIGFTRAVSRNEALEHFLVSSYILNSIPASVYSRLEVDTVDFAGRKIPLGPACRWMSPHNLQCPNYGQMNWAIFDDQREAEQYRDLHLQMNRNKGMTDIKEEKRLRVRFEGQETEALRVTIKINVPQFVMGGSNILHVYYLTAGVRGKYITCIMSHYSDDVNGDKLSPLLAKVMELM